MKRFLIALLFIALVNLQAPAQTPVKVDDSSQRHVLNALYGLIPGLQLYQNGSGYLPGDNIPLVTVRGSGSYSGNHTLIIVDGVVRDPSEIEVGEVASVTVLKDAASLARWGIRGADGAVLITTKRGSDKPFTLRTSVRTGIQTPYGIPAMASPVQYANALNEARSLDGLGPYYSASDIAGVAAGTNIRIPTMDWQTAMLRNVGTASDANLSIDGSTKSTKYYVYADYSSNRGFLRHTNLTDGINTQAEFYSLKLRSNLDVKVTPTTDLVIGLSGRLQQQQGPQGGLDITAMYAAPTIGIPARVDHMWVRTNLIDNPVGSVLGTGNKIDFGRSLLGDVALKQNLSMILDGLKAQARVSYDNAAVISDRKSFSYSYLTATPRFDEARNISDYALASYGNDTEIDFATYLSSQYMRLTALAGLEWTRVFDNHEVGASLTASRDWYKLTGAGNSFIHHDFILSLSYNYAQKIFLNIVMDESASSLLSTGDKYRFYPAVSLGWVVSDALKVKASAGLVGMDANLQYDMDKQFNGPGNGYIFTQPTELGGMKEGDLPSVGVRPETDFKADLGLEFILPCGLGGEAAVFMNNRSGLRTKAGNATSAVLGIGLGDSFNGKVSNRGIEGALFWDGKIGAVAVNLGGTISFVRSRIDYIEEEFHPDSYQYEQGGSVGRLFVLLGDGFYREEDFDSSGNLKEGVPESTFASVRPGDIRYKDLNTDGKIDNYDYTWTKTPTLPELYYGFHLDLSWNGLGLKALFQGTGDWTAVTNLPSIWQPLYGGDKNVSQFYIDNCWHPDSQEGARYPRLTTLENSNNFRDSDVWTQNGKYFKLRELELNYNFPASLLSNVKLQEATVFLCGNNLFSIDGIRIMDPEYIATAYPRARTFQMGVRLTF